jgi:hypothetical protein
MQKYTIIHNCITNCYFVQISYIDLTNSPSFVISDFYLKYIFTKALLNKKIPKPF